MSPLPMDSVTAAIQDVRQYHVRLACLPGIVYEGEFDLSEGRQYVQLGMAPGDFPLAEVFWQEQKGYGRRLDQESWLALRGGPLPNYLRHALDLLQNSTVVATHEDEHFWRVDLEPDQFPLRDDPEGLFREIYGDPPELEAHARLERMAEVCRTLQARAEMTISRKSSLITHVSVHVQGGDMASELRLDFGPGQGVPALPVEVPDQVLPHLRVKPESLLLHLPTIGGWQCYEHHAPWAQRAIQLIEEEEAGLPPDQRRFTEIYQRGGPDDFSQEPYNRLVYAGDPNKAPRPALHHPLVLGAWYEDAHEEKDAAGNKTRGLPLFYDDWFSSDPRFQPGAPFFYSAAPYNRCFHHFGGYGEGLEYHYYYWFASPPPTPTTNPAGNAAYYSARDWGYGLYRLTGKGKEGVNRLTFTRAIEQYHRYSREGKRNAYLMLGHVLHLFQDVGQPDHAKLVDHAASGYTEPEMYKKTYHCEILAAEAAAVACGFCWAACLWCAAGVFAATEAGCWATANPEEMGYERFAAENWDMAMVENVIRNTGCQHQPDYDAYFHAISEIAKNAVEEVKQQYPGANLDSPLGCGYLKAVPPIPGGEPDIDSTDPAQTQPFVELTSKIVPPLIALSAGLIEDFYAIVNYPPFVQRVAIVQWEPNARPAGFALLDEDQGPCLRHDYEWRMQGPGLRELHRTKRQMLSPDRPAYIFVLFGPAGIGLTKGRAMAEARLNVKGIYPPTGELIDTQLQLFREHDDEVGYYYWGVFYPHNCGADPFLVTLEIHGRDMGPHYAQRHPSGEELDAQPGTWATVDISVPHFPWMNYAPGVDRHHQVGIAPLFWDLQIEPQPLVIDRALADRGRVQFRISQKAWDCNWEEYDGPMMCPVEWGLPNHVTMLVNPPQHGTAGHFAMRTELTPERGGAVLEVRINSEHCLPGGYLVEVWFEVGDPPNRITQTIQVDIV